MVSVFVVAFLSLILTCRRAFDLSVWCAAVCFYLSLLSFFVIFLLFSFCFCLSFTSPLHCSSSEVFLRVVSDVVVFRQTIILKFYCFSGIMPGPICIARMTKDGLWKNSITITKRSWGKPLAFHFKNITYSSMAYIPLLWIEWVNDAIMYSYVFVTLPRYNNFICNKC